MFTITPLYSGPGSSLLGMNGGQPESPNGKWLVYARKASLETPLETDTEIWLCERDTLAGQRKLFTVHCENHNGPSASFVNDQLVVFRDTIAGLSAFRMVDIDSGKVVYGPIFAKESHCAENGLYPFSLSDEFIGKNPAYPALNGSGIYTLNIASGEIARIVEPEEILNMVKKAGYTPTPATLAMSHVQLNPAADRVMMRLSVAECPVFGALGEIDLATRQTHFVPDKPVHQLWFDNESYLATRQYYRNQKIEMASSRIRRFSLDGAELETLGGVGNHIDASPDRRWFVGDRAYPGYPADVLLYRRGEEAPAAVLSSQNFQGITWQKHIHPNPTFSRDGRRVYFNYPISDTQTQASFVSISSLL